MLRSLYSGVSGMKYHQIRMDVIGNNIANVNTVGFKSNRANFQDMFYQMLRNPVGVEAGEAGSVNPAQIGTGGIVTNIGINMTQGGMENTGRTLDLAIQGNGFFQVTDGTNLLYTRNGVFNVDVNGSVVDSNGYQLTDGDGNVIQITGGNDIVGTIIIGRDGSITATDTEGVTMEVSANIGLCSFANQEGLEKCGQNLFKEVTPVSGAATMIGTVGTSSTINSGYREMSNVDLTDEFTSLITTQRGYQANARTITTSDQMLQELLNIKQ